MKLLLAISLALLTSAPALAAPEYSILSVGDGDTVRVVSDEGNKTIRLACIDAPEKAQAPYGSNAKAFLLKSIPVGSKVSIKPFTTDRYGRLVAEVFSNGNNINLQVVRSGNAFVYRSFLKGCDKDAYLGAENEAKANKLGIWSDGTKGLIKPWVWRHKIKVSDKVTCKNLSKTEAQKLLSQGHIYLDKNNDGIACN